MKNLFCLLLSMVLFTSCYTVSMSGSPAAVSAGASIGGVLGSIVGERTGGWHGSQFGALVGTVAGAAIGNAVTTPRTEKVAVEEISEPGPYYALQVFKLQIYGLLMIIVIIRLMRKKIAN